MTVSVVVAVRDTAVKAFARPFFVPSIGYATRSFGDEVNRQAGDNPMHQHPEDFELWVLAEFDEDHGSFQAPADGVRLLVRGKDLLKAV